MRRFSFICAFLLMISTTNQVLASERAAYTSDTYFGISGSFLNLEGSGRYYSPSSGAFSFSGEVDGGTNLGMFAGSKFNQWVSAELRGYLGVEDADIIGTDLEISTYFSVYVRPTLPLHEYISIYGLVGYDVLTVEAFDESDTESDFSYGVGMELGKGTNFKLQIEWVLLHDEDYHVDLGDGGSMNSNLKISSINANMVWYF